jgi:hypothetical protein
VAGTGLFGAIAGTAAAFLLDTRRSRRKHQADTEGPA